MGNPILWRSLVIVMMCLLAGCEKGNHDQHSDLSGKQLFELHCSDCHRATGNGNFLKAIPANKNTHLSVLQISHAIRSGDGLLAKMPLFSDMSEQEAFKIALYLKSLQAK